MAEVYWNHLIDSMIFSSEMLFEREEKSLAPYGLRSADSKGRKYEELEDPYRTPYQRDRDRVVHSKAFRRLRGKTQVFIATFGDHYRSRLSHSLEVAQVSRDLARALGLNEDLCEVIALAHDLGHTPFGHAGEEAMHEMMTKCGDRFEHNDQSRRVVEVLERKSPDYRGLNLSFETLEGLMKHRKFNDDGKTPVVHSLESQLVDLSDAIAYHHHDLDDGLRSKILKESDLEQSLTLWRQAVEDLDAQELGEDLFRHTAVTRIISLLIHDALEHSDQVLRSLSITAPLTKPSDVPIVGFSPKMQEKVDQLSEYLGERFYLDDQVIRHSALGKTVIQGLFRLFSKRFELIPKALRLHLDDAPPHVVIKDYIAGMTDEYARKVFQDFQDMI